MEWYVDWRIWPGVKIPPLRGRFVEWWVDSAANGSVTMASFDFVFEHGSPTPPSTCVLGARVGPPRPRHVRAGPARACVSSRRVRATRVRDAACWLVMRQARVDWASWCVKLTRPCQAHP